MDFIGRKDDLKTLTDNYNLNHGFVVIYGRRRVGKTTIINEFIKDKKALYFLATEEIESQNIKSFTSSLAKFSGNDYLNSASFSDWTPLFKIFAESAPSEKKILVIDEFQNLVSGNHHFASVFQKVWDDILSKNNVMVILCGSYIRMMTAETLSHSSPLYGRRTAQIRLKPLKFTEIAEHYKSKSFSELAELYALTGGVPKYLEFFDNEKGVFENITAHVLNKNGYLYEEPIFLLDKEVKEPVSYFSILKTIAAGNRKLSDISGVLEMKSNQLSPYLTNLIELGIIERRVPVTEKYPDKSRRGIYIISDSFIRFWFIFVYPYRSEIERGLYERVLENIRENFVSKFLAFVYEDVCRGIFTDLCDKKLIPFTFDAVGSYWDKSVEIDVVALDSVHKRVFAGECKYHDSKQVDMRVLESIKEKCAGIFEGYDVVYGLFSATGFDSGLVEYSKMHDDVLLIDKTQAVL